MSKFRIYTLLAAALFVLASPWLITPELKAETEAPYCSCCEGPCEGCCCSMPVESSDNNDDSGCSCKISDIPAIPDQPFEIIDNRSVSRSDLSQDKTVVQTNEHHTPSVYLNRYSSGASPPDNYSPPLYILNTSFLI